MAAAKLDFLGSATLMENQADLLLPDAAATFVAGQPDMRLRQLMQDFLLNQRFRRDIFVRGHAHLPVPQVQRNRGSQVVHALKSLAKLDPKIPLPRGTANVDVKLLTAFDTVLKEGTASLAELGRAIGKGWRDDDLFRVAGILLAANALMPAAGIFRSAKPFDGQGQLRIPAEVNRRLLALAASPEEAGGKARPLVSSALGGTLPIGTVPAILLQTLTDIAGLDQAVDRSLDLMTKQGLSLRKDDKPVTDPAVKRTQLMTIAETFVEQELPRLMAAGIVESV
jgi:hypothetical protein